MEASERAEQIEWTKNRMFDAQYIIMQLDKRMKERGEKVSMSTTMGTLVTACDLMMELFIHRAKDPAEAELAIKAMEHSMLNGINQWRKEMQERKA